MATTKTSQTAQNGAAAADAAIQAATQATTAATEFAADAAKAVLPGVESTAGKVRELQETLVAQAKSVATLTLDAYDESLKSYVDFRKSLAEATQVDWVRDLAAHNAKIVTEVGTAYSTAVRELLK